jgi:hypothetical protein
MKWIAVFAVAATVTYLFTTEKGKRIRNEITGLVHEGKELKDYLGNIATDVRKQGLQYGEQPEPVASRRLN